MLYEVITWTDIGSGGDVDSDSSVPNVTTYSIAGGGAGQIDLATDDLSDGVADDDEATIVIGGNLV